MSGRVIQLSHASSRLRVAVRVGIICLVICSGILLAVMGLYRFAERQTNLASPQRLDSSKNVPLNIQRRVSDDPTFRWNVSTHTLPDRNSLKKIQMLNGSDGWVS